MCIKKEEEEGGNIAAPREEDGEKRAHFAFGVL